MKTTKPYSELAKLRMQAGLTQEQLASKMGVTAVHTVSLWENGKNIPSVEKIPLLADALEVDCLTVIDAIEGKEIQRREPLSRIEPSLLDDRGFYCVFERTNAGGWCMAMFEGKGEAEDYRRKHTNCYVQECYVKVYGSYPEDLRTRAEIEAERRTKEVGA